ncbi:MAG: RNA chaperone Hfq [Oscillospiraceae bacterium]|jgi:host factor-I protein|nr:RNA chaperone Hfq [Oscillospiraceae bacterium]
MQKTTNYQDLFLNQFRRDHQNVTVFLVNGFQIKGVVRAFDNFTVVMEADGRQQLIYKHAISTIIPFRPVSLPNETPAPQGETARPVG